MKKLVIFDLDGTLINTIEDLAAACDEVLKRNGLPTYSVAEYQEFVGSGIMRLVERALPEEKRTEEFVAKIRAEFVEYYFENIDKKTKVYRGIESLLRELQEREVAIAVASNKFQEGTRKLVASFFPDIRFEAVLGQRPNVPLKPHPSIIREIIQITSYAPDKILYVGDSGIDMQTAKAAGVESVGVSWGFRPVKELEENGADHIIDNPNDILSIIE
ncbi:MAG: HAD family hydrolase [Rikenellaceae bacterium]